MIDKKKIILSTEQAEKMGLRLVQKGDTVKWGVDAEVADNILKNAPREHGWRDVVEELKPPG